MPNCRPDRPLKVLITNIWLAGRGGTEAVVRDLALGLLARGQMPVVYSPEIGATGEEIRARGIPVLDDIRLVAEQPDIIHGHHLVPTAEAIIQFPDVPAISVCHAWVHWVEAPACFPQVQSYVAVDEACRQRILHTGGIEIERVITIPNSVDLNRVPVRPAPLNPKPLRALAFTKTSAQLPAIRSACEKLGVVLDTLGSGVGRFVAHPELELVQYDLVFATARSALEAICAGCAVVVCDGRGLSEMVTLENFHRLRDLNFGLRSLVHPVTVERLTGEIGKYDAADAAATAALASNEASFDVMLDRYLEVYRQAIGRAHEHPWTSADYDRALAAFLRANLPRRPDDRRWPWLPERDHLLAQIANADRRLAQSEAELVRLREQVETLKRETIAPASSAETRGQTKA